MQRLEREEETKRCQWEAKKVEEEKERATRKSRRKKIEEVGEEKEVVDVIGITEITKYIEESEKSDKKVAGEDITWLEVSEQLSDLELEEDDGDFLLSSVAGEVLTVENTNEESNTEQTLSCSPRCPPPRPSCPSRPHGARASPSNCSEDWLAANLAGFYAIFEYFVFCCECLIHHFSSDQGCLTEIRIDENVSPGQY